MENLNMTHLFGKVYQGKTVLITGHTGFKGSWLALWLNELGARVIGYSLEPPTTPNHYEVLGLNIESVIADIRDQNMLDQTFRSKKPDIIFHLAAQPLVRISYKEPIITCETNIIGTIRVLEACRKNPSVRAIVSITSDKCYENKEWIWGYRENDPMGGDDPYSASKGCAELMLSSYRNSFFSTKEFKQSHRTLLASARAGNAIGGGDWAEDRLIPDIVRATSKGKKVVIRNPETTRPWQHVLEPLSGYLLLGQKLLEGKKNFAESWNFGPNYDKAVSVIEIVKMSSQYWDKIGYEICSSGSQLRETKMLRLDCSKARFSLNWESVWDLEMALKKTINWYRNFYENGNVNSRHDLYSYVRDASCSHLSWVQK